MNFSFTGIFFVAAFPNTQGNFMFHFVTLLAKRTKKPSGKTAKGKTSKTGPRRPSLDKDAGNAAKAKKAKELEVKQAKAKVEEEKIKKEQEERAKIVSVFSSLERSNKSNVFVTS